MQATTYPDVGSPLFYTVFTVIILVMILIDMFSLKQSGSHKVGIREALGWTIVWISISCCFALWLYYELSGNPLYGQVVANEKVLEFFTAYVLEKSLAVDNIFVFLLIFAYFKVPDEYQHRVLLYGVFGAIILRTIMIGLGAVLVKEFEWILYIFGAFLVFTGIKLFLPEKEDGGDLSNNGVLKMIRKVLPVTHDFQRELLWVKENGKWIATPLFMVLVMVEISDIIFAVDSIPAVFAVTTDPFIVLTSNLFAVLGLRAMYFLLANVADKFIYLRYGLAVVLTFIGVKMLIVDWVHIPVTVSLTVVFVSLTISILASLLKQKNVA